MSAVTQQSWAYSLLQALGDPTNSTNLKIIMGWEAAEGGNWNNSATYNPLNTTQKMPGSAVMAGGSTAGVQAYTSWGQGLQATVETLKNGDYGVILSMLAPGTATASQAATAISSTPWNPGGYSDLDTLINEQTVSPSDTGATITYKSEGGAAGLGGTGVKSNSASNSLFYVADAQNPDQDYWTAINNETQQAYWYCFSDGEYLYVADGYEIMQQPPAAVIYRLSSNLIHADFTYDNTAFQFASTHTKKAKIQRKSKLAKVTSPVEGSLSWVCEIDDLRAGDIVELVGFGPAIDGPWLLGDCTRSVFQVYSQLTLVPPMQPQPVASSSTVLSGSAASAPGAGTVIAAMIQAASTVNNAKIPYVWGGGRPTAGKPSIGIPGPGYNGTTVGFDCSGAVAGVLHAGGLWASSFTGSDVTVIQTLRQNSLILPGAGSGSPECTLYDNPGVHIFMSLNGKYWGTSDGGGTTTAGGGSGGAWLNYGPDVANFSAYHVPPKLLEQVIGK